MRSSSSSQGRRPHLIAAILSGLCLALATAAVPAAARNPGPVSDADTLRVELDAAKAAMMRDPTAALDHARKAEAAALASKASDQETATALWLQAEALIRTNAPDKAMSIVRQGLDMIADEAPAKLQADLLMAQGAASAALGDITSALGVFLKAHEVYRAAKEPRGQAKALQEIGNIYQDAGEYRRALDYYGQSAEIYGADLTLLVTAYNNRANAYRELGQFAEADREFARALEVARRMGSPLIKAHILTNMAEANIQAGRLDAASVRLDEAFAAASVPSAAQQLPFVHGVAAGLALARNDRVGARRHLDQAFAGVDLASSLPPYREFHLTAYKLFKGEGEWALALRHLEAYGRLEEETRSLATDANAALMAARFDFTNQNLRIANLKAGQLERDVKLAQTQTQMITLLLGASVIVLALLAFAFLSARRNERRIRRANEKLSLANTSLEKALAAKTEFLATTSHEIRTPLNGILGMTQVMLADRRLEAGAREKVGLIHAAGETMKALVDDILDLAKIESGKLSVAPAPMDLRLVLSDTAKLWSQKAQAKGLAVRLDMDHAPLRIIEDEGRLRQVLFNLMSNAIKFTETGHVQLAARTKDTADGERLVLEISDTGIGIPEDMLEAIFESFRQVDGGVTRKYGGTGLGLAICRNIAEALGGSLSVTSHLGEGSTFTLDLPLRHADPAVEPAAADGAAGPDEANDHASCRGLKDVRLLLVEANPLAQSMLRAVLDPEVRSLEICTSEDAMLEALQARTVDHVILEGRTIGGDMKAACDLIARISALPEAPAVSLLWSQPSSELQASLISAGAAMVLAKPMPPGAILGRLRQWAASADTPETVRKLAQNGGP